MVLLALGVVPAPGGRVRLSPFVSFLLSPSLDAWHGSLVIRGVFRGHACVFEAQKRVFERTRALH